MSIAREWKNNGRYPYHSFENSKQEAKIKKFSKENNVSPKEKHVSSRGRSMNDLGKRKMPPKFLISPPISPRKEWYVVQHKKFSQKLIRTQKKENVEIKSHGEKTTSFRNAARKAKEGRES